MDNDLRQADRTALFLEVHYEGAGVRAQARISDISLHGIFLDTVSSCPVGATLLLSFTLPGEYLVKTEGVVVHCLPGIGMGVKFTSLSPGDACRIRDAVSENHPLL